MQTIPKRLKLTKSPSRYESDEQENYLSWSLYVRHNGHRLRDFVTAVPNGAWLMGTPKQKAIQIAFLKRQGMRVGYPDLIIDIPMAHWHGLRIEMKRIGAPKFDVEGDQGICHARLVGQGYCVQVCYGFEAAKTITLEYLGMK